jgi:hypothetical protein
MLQIYSHIQKLRCSITGYYGDLFKIAEELSVKHYGFYPQTRGLDENTAKLNREHAEILVATKNHLHDVSHSIWHVWFYLILAGIAE